MKCLTIREPQCVICVEAAGKWIRLDLRPVLRALELEGIQNPIVGLNIAKNVAEKDKYHMREKKYVEIVMEAVKYHIELNLIHMQK